MAITLDIQVQSFLINLGQHFIKILFPKIILHAKLMGEWNWTTMESYHLFSYPRCRILSEFVVGRQAAICRLQVNLMIYWQNSVIPWKYSGLLKCSWKTFFRVEFVSQLTQKEFGSYGLCACNNFGHCSLRRNIRIS
jgi:hypothetical protein